MKPKSITLKNYKSYGDDETRIDLDVDSVRLIVGKSGSGKTSIIDAILWCLYGQSLCKADEVVNRQTGKNCKVEYEFSIGESEYSVIRYRKHEENNNKVLIFKNGKNISPLKVAEAQQLIQDIIEISPNSLVSSVIFSSEIYSSFMREKNSVRLNVLEGILSLRQVNKWNEVTKKLVKPITEKILELDSKRLTAEGVANNIKETVESYKEKSMATLKSLKAEKKAVEQEIEALSSELDKIQKIDIKEELKKAKEYENLERENALFEHQAEILKAKKTDLTSKLLDIGDLKDKIQNVSKINVEEYIKDYETYKEVSTRNKEIESQIREAKLSYVDSKKIEEQIRKAEEKVILLEKEIEEISHEMTCPTCHQKLPEELQNELGLLKERELRLKDEENGIVDLRVSLQGAVEANEATDETIERLQLQLKPIKERNFQHSPEEIRKIDKQKNELKSDLKVMLSEYENAEKRNEELDEEIKEEKKKIVELGDKPEHESIYLETLSVRVEEIKKGIQEKENRFEVINEKAKSTYDKSYIEDLESKKGKVRKGIEKLEKDLEKKRFDERHYQYLLKMFSNKEGGLKKIIIGQMINVFNEEINKYLPLFFDDDITLNFDKNLVEEIKVNEKEVSFDTFSSGEKTRFEFAIAFSLFMLVKNFFSKDVNFIVFDEILDMNLDEESLEKVLAVVQDLGEKNSILVISHRTELKEIFTNHIVVSKDNNGDSIVEAA